MSKIIQPMSEKREEKLMLRRNKSNLFKKIKKLSCNRWLNFLNNLVKEAEALRRRLEGTKHLAVVVIRVWR